MRAGEIAQLLGASHRSGDWWRCVCPVHGSRTRRSATLALRDGDNGLVVYCHAGCDRDDILNELRHRDLISSKSRAYDGFRPQHPSKRTKAADTADRLSWARRIWATGLAARGTPIVEYFARRAINLDPPPCLRWAPHLRRPDKTSMPGMVALVRHVNEGVVGVHRTWLDSDAAGNWRRLDRKSLGPVGGGAVRLAKATATLMVGEGLESCLSAMQATGLPAWAALSAGGMESLILPTTVRYVVILADNDANRRGQKAAWNAAQRWTADGRSVRIAMPPETGTDFNDLLTSAASRGGEIFHA